MRGAFLLLITHEPLRPELQRLRVILRIHVHPVDRDGDYVPGVKFDFGVRESVRFGDDSVYSANWRIYS